MIDDDHSSTDAELRELFSRLRQEEALRTPPFIAGSKSASSVSRKSLPSPLGRILAGAHVCVATIVAAIFWLRHEPVRRVPARTGAPIVSITEWRPATGFLLNTYGSEIMRTAPSLELRPYLGPTPSFTQRTGRPRKRPSR